jgi:hypothetical protein
MPRDRTSSSPQYQQFPTTGPLLRNLDRTKKELKQLVGGESDAVYAYIMSSVQLEGHEFRQIGCGPNFEGRRITLCTCKHRMRTSLTSDQWRGKWIAGFTSVECGGHHWLFYFARVMEAFESQAELWFSGLLPAEAQRTKSTRASKFGDLYEPKGRLGIETRFDPSHYYPPMDGHNHRNFRHKNTWLIDIDYYRKRLKCKPKQKHPACLLLCDPNFSFIWRHPLLYVDGRWRHRIYGSLDDFFEDLSEGQLRHHGKAGRPTACGY